MDAEKIVNDMVIRLGKHRGQYKQISDSNNDLDYSWVTKFAAGKMKNPTIKRLESLSSALDRLEKAAAA